MKTGLTLFILISFFATKAQEIPKAEDQIKVAVLAAPVEMRDGAMVYGYNEKGDLVVLRKGSNKIICLGDDPKVKGINISSYHADLEPFMARRRKLRAEGKTNQQLFDIGEAEVKAGALPMPKNPTTLFVITAEEWDATTNSLKSMYQRSVVYIPFATSESTGLPSKPNEDSPGLPWIMDAGTHRAHIMISPVKN